jgi:predicted nucleic acid-binding protein
MKVLVDSSIWSLALHRNEALNQRVKEVLSRLIEESQVVMIGPIRQDLLSGIKSEIQFNHLKTRLAPFPDYPLTTRDYELAAEYFNICRSSGVQGSKLNFLICAVATNNRFQIFTLDQDFSIFSQHLPIIVYSPQSLNGRL